MCSLGAIRKSRQLEHALTEADAYITLTDQERLSKCQYTESSVKVEDLKKALTSTSTEDLEAEGKVVPGNSTGRKRCSSNTSRRTTHVKQPLGERTSNVKQGNSSSQSHESMTGTREDSLRIEFSENSSLSLVANTLMKQIQHQVMAALSQATTSMTEPIRGMV